MKTRAVPIFLISLLLLSAPAFGIVYTNETKTELTKTSAICYGDDARDIIDYSFINFNDTATWCTGSFFTPPQGCLRQLKLDNLDNKKNQITVEVDPTPLNLPCPAPTQPTTNNVWVKFAPNGDDGKAQTQVFDMNSCWGWWCGGSTGYNKTVCPFDYDWLDTFGICKTYSANYSNAIKDCPSHRFDIGSDTDWINVSWGWDSANDRDVEFEIGFIGLSTSKRVKVVESNYESIIKATPTHQILAGAIGSIMQMNTSFLTIIYYIAETAMLIFVVIALPTGALLVIKYLWQQVTGRPLGRTRRKV